MTLFCDRCRYPLLDGKYVYSRHTGKHYCYPLSECERRLRRELTPEEITITAKYWKSKLLESEVE